MMETKDLASRPIPLRSQIAYSFSELAANPLYTIMMSFLTFFYTDILGVNAAAVGAIILSSKVLDGVSDIWAGHVIDRTHTRNGSARPWLIRTAVPLALTYVLLFTVPDVGNMGKYIYIFISYNLAMTVVYTFFSAAIGALPLYMTRDTKTRASAYAIRLLVAGLVQLAVSMVFLNVIDSFGGGQRGWIIAAAILGTVSFLAILVVYFFTKETIVSGEAGEPDASLLAALKAILKNKYWFIGLGIMFIAVLHQVATLTVGVYYAKYILNDANLVGNLILYHHGPGLIVLFCMPILLQKGFQKRKIGLIGAGMMLAGSVLSLFFGSGMLLVVSLAMRGIGAGAISGIMMGLLADAVEYGEWKTGVSAKAVTACAYGVGQKLGAGIGAAAFGVALSAAGYDGLAATQTAGAISAIHAIFIVLPIFIYILLLVLIYLFKLEKDLPDIQRELAERREI